MFVDYVKLTGSQAYFLMRFLLQGVGNTLKRHYETYLLEYELAHDDVDGECCLLCHRFVKLLRSANANIIQFMMISN
jgi:hypothetical protein